MKATQDNSFRPVTLILESQEEVDLVFGILNTASLCLLFDIRGKDYYLTLKPYASSAAEAVWVKLSRNMK